MNRREYENSFHNESNDINFNDNPFIGHLDKTDMTKTPHVMARTTRVHTSLPGQLLGWADNADVTTPKNTNDVVKTSSWCRGNSLSN